MSAFQTEEPFDLPVMYKGHEVVLPSRLVQRGYSYAIYVEVEGVEVIFEPDEERNFRAIFDSHSASPVTRDIVEAIMVALEKHLR